MSAQPLRVALLGCGTVGSRGGPAAARAGRRPGRPDRRAARARRRSRVRRPGRAPRTSRSTRRCSPPTPLGLVKRDDVDVVVEVIGGIEPARTLLLEALRAGKSRGHRQQGAAGRGRRDAARRGRRGAAPTSTTRPPSPARSRCCARCASRWPATGSPGSSASSTAPPTSSCPRWTRTGAGFADALAEATALGLRRGRPDRRRRGLRRRGQGRDPGRRSPSTPG